MENNKMTRTTEGIVAFVESKIKFRIGLIEHLPSISNKQVVFVGRVLVLVAPFVIKRI